MKAFDQEGAAYTSLIPALQRLRQDKNLKPLAFAKCFYSSPEDLLIILENMKAQGFSVIEKKPERKFRFNWKSGFESQRNQCGAQN